MPSLNVDILTLFPEMFSGVLSTSILGRAIGAGLVDVRLTNFREFARDRHRSVDDRPYGGGPGMVFSPEPVVDAVESVLASARGSAARSRFLILTPQGRRIGQAELRELAAVDWIVLVCGHYEGFDERIRALLTGNPPQGADEPGVAPGSVACGGEPVRFEEVSIGDYVLTGGEIPSMAILDGVVRLLPGALGDPESAVRESFEEGLLDHPHYTRPPEFRGLRVPEVLISGDHGRIASWRRDQAERRTRERRADLLDGRADLLDARGVETPGPGSRDGGGESGTKSDEIDQAREEATREERNSPAVSAHGEARCRI